MTAADEGLTNSFTEILVGRADLGRYALVDLSKVGLFSRFIRLVYDFPFR